MAGFFVFGVSCGRCTGTQIVRLQCGKKRELGSAARPKVMS